MKVYSHFERVPQAPVDPWWLGLPMRVHWGRAQPCGTAPCHAEVGVLVPSVLPWGLWAKTSKTTLVQPLCHNNTAVPQSVPSRTGHTLAPKWGCTDGPSAVGSSPGISPGGGGGQGVRRAAAIPALKNPAPVDAAAFSSATCVTSPVRTMRTAKFHIWQQAKEKLICHCCWRAANASHPSRRDLGAQDTRRVLLKQRAVDKKVKAADSCTRMPRHGALSVPDRAT